MIVVDTAAVEAKCPTSEIVDGVATVDDENNENWASADSKSFQNVMFLDDAWSDKGQVDDKYATVAPAGVENTAGIVSYSYVCHISSFFHAPRSSFSSHAFNHFMIIHIDLTMSLALLFYLPLIMYLCFNE